MPESRRQLAQGRQTRWVRGAWLVVATLLWLTHGSSVHLTTAHAPELDTTGQIIAVPGWSATGSVDCDDLFTSLQGRIEGWQYDWTPGDWRKVELYNNEDSHACDAKIWDNHGDHDLVEGTRYNAHHRTAGGVIDGHTGDTPIEHLAYHLATYLADEHEYNPSDPDDPNARLQLVGYSMGGLIIRFMMLQMAGDFVYSDDFPDPATLNIEDVVTAGTPHGAGSNVGLIGSMCSLVHNNGPAIVTGLTRLPIGFMTGKPVSCAPGCLLWGWFKSPFPHPTATVTASPTPTSAPTATATSSGTPGPTPDRPRLTFGGLGYQCRQLDGDSEFMRFLYNHAAAPDLMQGDAATDWTLLGSTEDGVVAGEAAVNMVGARGAIYNKDGHAIVHWHHYWRMRQRHIPYFYDLDGRHDLHTDEARLSGRWPGGLAFGGNNSPFPHVQDAVAHGFGSDEW